MVLLPDHLHAVWTLPVGDCDYATRWMLIKAGFSRRIAKAERRSKAASPKPKGWQPRYWEHLTGMSGIMQDIWITSITT